MAKPWSEVEASQAYQALAPQQQMAAKQEYFMSVVATKPEYQSLSPQQQSAAQQEFFGGISALPTSSNHVIQPMWVNKSGTPIWNPVELAQAKKEINRSEDLVTKRNYMEEKAKTGKGLALVNEIEANWMRTKPPELGTMPPQPLHGALSKIGSLFQITEDQRNDRNYVRFVKQFQSRLAKGAVGEDVGNLAQQEQQIVREGMPGLTDYKETGEDMLAITKKALRAMREAREQGYADVFGFVADKGKKLDKETATKYFKKAKGNPDRATLFAIADGYNPNE
jgi:hypothetical protein